MGCAGLIAVNRGYRQNGSMVTETQHAQDASETRATESHGQINSLIRAGTDDSHSASVLTFFFHQPIQIRFKEALNFTVEHFLKIADVVPGASVLNPLVWMQEVISNL